MDNAWLRMGYGKMTEERETAARYSLALEARRTRCENRQTSGSRLSRLRRMIARALAAGCRRFLAHCACIVDSVDFAAERELRAASLLQPHLIGRDVARLQLLTAEEIDLVQHLPAAGISLADLLERKDQDPARNMGFKNFLLRSLPDQMRARGPARQRELERVRKLITELIVGPRNTESASATSA